MSRRGRKQAHDAAWLKRAAKRDLDAGSNDDRRWFKNHIGRNHRIREPIGTAERMVSAAQVPPGFTPVILLRQVEPGSRFRSSFGWPPSEPLPLNAEQVGEMLFRIIFTGADVTIVDLRR